MSPRLAWLPFAMGHLPLFYATLLTAAVHLNRRRPLKDPSALIWFKVQTIKMANEAMIDPAEAASDQMIIVALVLLYFNVRTFPVFIPKASAHENSQVGGGNTAEYEIHLKGINDMLKIRGGKHKLGMRGMVKNWLAICHGPWSDGWEDGCF
jgi:hypothetical protein